MDTEEEARFRLAWAHDLLRRAEEQLTSWAEHRESFHLAAAVGDAQACIEAAAKAVIACTRVPSKTHDPSDEVLEILREARQHLPAIRARALRRLAAIAREAAPEHARAIYGDESRRIPPSQLYDEATARRFVTKASVAYRLADAFVTFWFRRRKRHE